MRWNEPPNIIAFTVATGEVLATKTFRKRNGAIEKSSYPRGATWWVYRRISAYNLRALLRHLRRLIDDPYVMLMNGAPLPHLDLSRKHRRWSSKKHISAGTHTIEGVPVACFVLDCDDYVAEAGMGWGDQLEVAAPYVLKRLPPCLEGCQTLVVASSSTGFKKDFRLVNFRAFIQLDRKYDLGELYRWARSARAAGYSMIDPRVMLPGQPIYVARPRLIGVADPVPRHRHAFIIEGRPTATIDVTEFQHTLERHEAQTREYVATGDVQGWRSVLTATLGTPAYSFFDALQLSLGIAARSADSIDDIVAFTTDLLAERADADRIDHYDAGWIEEAVTSFRTSDSSSAHRTQAIYARLLSNPTKFNAGE